MILRRAKLTIASWHFSLLFCLCVLIAPLLVSSKNDEGFRVAFTKRSAFRELSDPVELGPHYDADLDALVTTVTLRVKLKRLVTPLWLEAEEEGNRIEKNQNVPTFFFTYTGRVYEMDNYDLELSHPIDDFYSTMNSSTLNFDGLTLLASAIPGPTLRVAPGGFLRLRLINDLGPDENKDKRRGSQKESRNASKNDSTILTSRFPDSMFYTMHHPNITNMHFHGLHCDPFIDNPFVALAPKSSPNAGSRSPQENEHEYLVPIPPDHVPGLHWYHAHSHGSVYFQLMGGLFGALSVEDGESTKSYVLGGEKIAPPNKERANDSCERYYRPWLSKIPSHLVVFNLYRLGPGKGKESCDGQTMEELDELIGNSVQPSDAKMLQRTEDGRLAEVAQGNNPENLFLVNGQHRPVLRIREGQPTLLRMVFAAGACELNISFPLIYDSPILPDDSSSGKGTSNEDTLASEQLCDIYPVAVDGVPFNLTWIPPSSKYDLDKSKHSPPKKGPVLSPVNATSWLYFTPATRHEVVVVCSRRGKFSLDSNNQSLLDKPQPVRNQVGEVIFFLEVISQPTERDGRTDEPILDKDAERKSLKNGGGRKKKIHPFPGEALPTENISHFLFPIIENHDLHDSCGSDHRGDLEAPKYLTVADTRNLTELRRRNHTNHTHSDSKTSEPNKFAEQNPDEVLSSSVFNWDISLSQRFILPSSGANSKSSTIRPFYGLGEGRDCRTFLTSPDKSRGVVFKSDAPFLEKEDDFYPAGNENQSSCYYHPFEGPRGETNMSAYHGFVVPLNGVVEVHIFGDPTDEMPHPFHFHVNHFQFLSFIPRPNGVHAHHVDQLRSFGIWPGQWRDTIPILDGETIIRWRAADYHGEILYHCHMLSHEDRGMMSSYFIIHPKSSLTKTWLNQMREHLHVLATAITLAILSLFFGLLFWRRWRKDSIINENHRESGLCVDGGVKSEKFRSNSHLLAAKNQYPGPQYGGVFSSDANLGV